MQLPPTAVTATIDDSSEGLKAGGGDRVNITVAANATAMFVVTIARGESVISAAMHLNVLNNSYDRMPL